MSKHILAWYLQTLYDENKLTSKKVPTIVEQGWLFEYEYAIVHLSYLPRLLELSAEPYYCGYLGIPKNKVPDNVVVELNKAVEVSWSTIIDNRLCSFGFMNSTLHSLDIRHTRANLLKWVDTLNSL